MTAAGGATVDDFSVLLGGAMMAKLAAGVDVPVTKTTGGIVVLPSIAQPDPAPQRKVAGDCPCRTVRMRPVPLLHGVLPALSAGASHPAAPRHAVAGLQPQPGEMIAGTLYCCECNLCSLYACPEDLDPKNVCTESKPAARANGLSSPERRSR